MKWLNYHHLHYFWVVATEGSVAAACAKLYVSQPAISNQLHALEKSVGCELFHRIGKKLLMTDTGRLVFRYAEQIFSLGRELLASLDGSTSNHSCLRVGLARGLPRLIIGSLLQPVFELAVPPRLVCSEDLFERLVAELVSKKLDLLLSYTPVLPTGETEIVHQPLGESGVAFFAGPALARRYRQRFPKSLNGAPVLLPAPSLPLRPALDCWFDAQGIKPEIRGEFDSPSVMRVFGEQGLGIFPLAGVVGKLLRANDIQLVGHAESVCERYYASFVRTQMAHPAVTAILHSGLKTGVGPVS
jgi:LysR family transcriptional activator of nhaA